MADAEALPTVEAYAAAGQRFGGIGLVPTAVTVSGPTAAVTYDVLFGTTTRYRALQGSAIEEAGGWTVAGPSSVRSWPRPGRPVRPNDLRRPMTTAG